MNVNFEPIIRRLKSDIFEVYTLFHICSIQLQKKKVGYKNVWKFFAIEGGLTFTWQMPFKFHFILNPFLTAVLCI